LKKMITRLTLREPGQDSSAHISQASPVLATWLY
jgi:hypothetical protein